MQILSGLLGSVGGGAPTASDQIIPQGSRFPGDPGSGGIGGGAGPLPGIERYPMDEKIGPLQGPSGEILGGEKLQDLIKFVQGT